MRTPSHVIFLLILLQFSGCAHYYASKDNLNKHIDEWLANNEYGKIDSAIKHLSDKHPEYKLIKSRISGISKRKNQYINNAINKAHALRDKNKWQPALEVYDKALDKIPENVNLINEREKLIKERDALVHELNKNMLLERARALAHYKDTYKKLQMLIPNDYKARYDINKYNKDREETAAQLMNFGKRAHALKDYALAEECFVLSNQLIAHQSKVVLINKLRSRRKNIDEAKKVKQLLAAYKKAYESGDTPKAKNHLDILISLKPDDKSIHELKAKLEQETQKKVEKGIDNGKDLYTKGKVNQALAIWNKLLTIDPKNEELNALISRAEKVSKKIQNLEKSSPN